MKKSSFSILRSRPLLVLIAIIVLELLFSAPDTRETIIGLSALAFVNTIASSMSSRSRVRNNILYHLVAICGSFALAFFMFRTVLRSHISLGLLPGYMMGTALGSIVGGWLSIRVEQRLGALADEDIHAKDVLKRDTTQAALVILITIVTCGWLLHFHFFPHEDTRATALIVILIFVSEMTFAMRMWLQNRNNDVLNCAASFVNGVIDFFRLAVYITFGMEWAIFVPYTSGGVTGSILGTLIASRWGKKTGASADMHVKTGIIKPLDYRLLWFLAAVLVVGTVFFPPKNHAAAIPFFVSAITLHMSYTFVSRARNRNDTRHHLYSSLCSNGIWFLTIHQLDAAQTDIRLVTPYTVGVVLGILLAVRVAMHIERKTGALADAHIK